MFKTKASKKSISIIDAPVATTASIILYLIKSEYKFIQPAADVEPAMLRI